MLYCISILYYIILQLLIVHFQVILKDISIKFLIFKIKLSCNIRHMRI